jgi:hypothetical protein
MILQTVLLTHHRYSACVATKGANQVYDVATVVSGFFTGEPFIQYGPIHGAETQLAEVRLQNLQDLVTSGQAWNKTRWTNLTVAECKDYTSFESDRGSVLLITEDPDAPAPSNVTKKNIASRDHASGSAASGSVSEYWFLYPYQSSNLVERSILSSRHRILYCLSLEVPDRCRLQLHFWLLLTTVTCNVVKLVCFTLTFKEQSGTPLMTVGDAVASFLESPEPVSRGMCLFAKDELIKSLATDPESDNAEERCQPKQFKTQALRYYQSVSFMRWTVYATSYVGFKKS